MQIKSKKNSSGRPPKFHEPRRPVTMTLPDRILDQLTEIDPDRTCAVVKVTEAVMGASRVNFKPVELVEMAPGKSLVVVGPCKALRKISWLKPIEIARARYILTISSGVSIEALEVALLDLSHHSGEKINDRENKVLQELLKIIGHHRRAKRLSKAEIIIVDTD